MVSSFNKISSSKSILGLKQGWWANPTHFVRNLTII